MTKQEIQHKRFKFLKKLYDDTEADENTSVSPDELGEELGLSESETDRICTFLNSEGLITTYISGSICITHKDILKVEKEPLTPNETEEQTNINQIHINGYVTQSNIIVGNENKSNISINKSHQSKYPKIERLMPALLGEMRQDVLKYPTTREFVILKRSWSYNSKGPYLAYYLDDHEDLAGKLQILENLGLIREITYTNVRRFVFQEELVDYLIEPQEL